MNRCSEAVEAFLKEIDFGTTTNGKLEVVAGMIDAFVDRMQRV